MKITLEVEVDHLDVEIKVGDPITLEELAAAAGSDLDAVVTSLSRLPEELKGTVVERGLPEEIRRAALAEAFGSQHRHQASLWKAGGE